MGENCTDCKHDIHFHDNYWGKCRVDGCHCDIFSHMEVKKKGKSKMATGLLAAGTAGLLLFFASILNIQTCVPYSDVYTIGDSITAPGQYQKTLDELLGSNSTSHVFAVPGYTCEQVKDLYSQNVPNGTNVTVVVFCGINDIALNRTPAEIETTLIQIINLSEEKKNNLVLVNIVPDTGGQGFCNATREVNGWLSTAKVPVVDFYRTYYNGTDCYTDPSLTIDGLHPNEYGNILLGQTIFWQGFEGKRFGTCKSSPFYKKLFGG